MGRACLCISDDHVNYRGIHHGSAGGQECQRAKAVGPEIVAAYRSAVEHGAAFIFQVHKLFHYDRKRLLRAENQQSGYSNAYRYLVLQLPDAFLRYRRLQRRRRGAEKLSDAGHIRCAFPSADRRSYRQIQGRCTAACKEKRNDEQLCLGRSQVRYRTW